MMPHRPRHSNIAPARRTALVLGSGLACVVACGHATDDHATSDAGAALLDGGLEPQEASYGMDDGALTDLADAATGADVADGGASPWLTTCTMGLAQAFQGDAATSDCPLPGGCASPELLKNTGFEGGATGLAADWAQNTWGTNSSSYVTWSAETDPAKVHGGTRAQRIQFSGPIPGGGGSIVIQGAKFASGHVYEGRIWLRADAPMDAKVTFRKSTFYYNTGAAEVLRVGTTWQEVVVRGGYSEDIDGQILIEPETAGTLYLDDASLKDVTAAWVSAPVVSTAPVPRSLFGMHVNKLGAHHTWPPVGIGTLRLWNTGTNWADVEPTKGAIDNDADWMAPSSAGFRMTYYLSYAQSNDPTVGLLYTMGVTPVWAAGVATPDFYAGTAHPPTSLDDWRHYARTMAQRFGSRVHAWEIWNEADQTDQFAGTAQELVELTNAASAEIKPLDPAHRILSPNVTSIGSELLARMLSLGLGDSIDVVSFHHYPSPRPEESIPVIVAMRDVMQRHGISAKPLWNTEGSVGGNPGVPGLGAGGGTISDELAVGAVARTYLLQWLYGVSNFNWYIWDDTSGPQQVTLSSGSDYATLTPAGVAYREIADWLVGARAVFKSVSASGTGGQRWLVALDRPSPLGPAWIVWDTVGADTLHLSPGCGITQQRDLAGLRGPAGSTVAIGIRPILLETTL